MYQKEGIIPIVPSPTATSLILEDLCTCIVEIEGEELECTIVL